MASHTSFSGFHVASRSPLPASMPVARSCGRVASSRGASPRAVRISEAAACSCHVCGPAAGLAVCSCDSCRSGRRHGCTCSSRDCTKCRSDGSAVAPAKVLFGLLPALLAVGASSVLLLGPMDQDAMAAQSGGRVGGSAFRTQSTQRAAPRPSAPPPSNTVVVSPSPSVVFVPSPPPFYGGWGWGSPFAYAPVGPSVSVGFGGFGIFSFLIGLFVVGAIGTALFGRRE